ncbi:L,D-transpeptidase [candidate division WOR-3 bacterium]|uniref:L,D-transpeptidase n=1 Tax=candidate division WOR-3 bacterium TaxID=2052148 RepID=A0A937XIM4_UNCW3|nr:L,D-transpeptidase [candidate division WOR-3 bacterium]
MSPVKSIGIILLSALVMLWSEVYFPVKDSIGLDIFRLAYRMYKTRAETVVMRLELPKLGPEIEALNSSVKQLAEQFATAFTSELYVVVNPNGNRLSLLRGQKVVLEAAISTGKNTTLRHGSRTWVFQTPRGIMSVIRKKKDPVWLKPDWAFLETGESIPAWNSPLRREKGVLGAFLLDLGGGVMIHGTPQEHLLGRSVTHGCIRVGYEDLKVLYDSVEVGTKVFIF